METVKCLCGLKCRKTGERDCGDGKYFYRCGSLNVQTKEYYNEALRLAQTYDFDKNRIGEPRRDFSYINGKSRKSPCPTEPTEMNKREGKEAFICRCYTRLSTGDCRNETCKNKIGFSKENGYEIVDYQVPPAEGACGRVDLVFKRKQGEEIYLVEVKPPRVDSPERLLRMICEIVSYYYPLADKNSAYRDYVTYRTCGAYPSVSWDRFIKHRRNYPENIFFSIIPAVAFFEGSPQEIEYKELAPEIEELLQKFGIAVFCLSPTGEIRLIKQY